MVLITPQEAIFLSLMCQWIALDNKIINKDHVKSIESGYIDIYNNVGYCIPRSCYFFEEEPCYQEEIKKEFSFRDDVYKITIANTENDDRTYNKDHVMIISQKKNTKMYVKIKDYLEKCAPVK